MIVVTLHTPHHGKKVSPRGLKTLVRTVCRRFGVPRGTVGIAIVGDDQMRAINRRFLGRNGTTDCFSFDLSDATERTDKMVLEIVVNGAEALREAEARGHSPQAELALYVLHGLLHQLGFDDITLSGAHRMHRTEDEILQELGYGVVYSGRPAR